MNPKKTFTISLSQQKRIGELWEELCGQQQLDSGKPIIIDVLKQQPKLLGMDCQVTEGELCSILLAGYIGDTSKLGRSLDSALTHAFCQLEEMRDALAPPRHRPYRNNLDELQRMLRKKETFVLSPHDDRQVINFVILAAISRKLAIFCDVFRTSNWATGTAVVLAAGLGNISQIIKYSTIMDEILACIFYCEGDIMIR